VRGGGEYNYSTKISQRAIHSSIAQDPPSPSVCHISDSASITGGCVNVWIGSFILHQDDSIQVITPNGGSALAHCAGFGIRWSLRCVDMWWYLLSGVQIAEAASSSSSPVGAICFRRDIRMLPGETVLGYTLLGASPDDMALAAPSLDCVGVHSSDCCDTSKILQALLLWRGFSLFSSSHHVFEMVIMV
jgi:hypothetical protein